MAVTVQYQKKISNSMNCLAVGVMSELGINSRAMLVCMCMGVQVAEIILSKKYKVLAFFQLRLLKVTVSDEYRFAF